MLSANLISIDKGLPFLPSDLSHLLHGVDEQLLHVVGVHLDHGHDFFYTHGLLGLVPAIEVSHHGHGGVRNSSLGR